MLRLLLPVLLLSPLAAQIPGSELFQRDVDFFAVEQHFATQPWDPAYQAILDAAFNGGLQLPDFTFDKTGSGHVQDPNVVFENLRDDPVWRSAGVSFEDFMAAMCTAGTGWELAEGRDELIAGLDEDIATLTTNLDALRDKPRLHQQCTQMIASLTALRDSLSSRTSLSDAPPRPQDERRPEELSQEPTMFQRMRARMKRRMRKMREARRLIHEAIFNPYDR